MTSVLIAGAGYVGGELARVLATRGHQVWAVRRSDWVDRPPTVSPIQADLCDRPALEAALERGVSREIDWLVYAVSAGRGGQAPRAAYAQGVETLLESLAARGVTPSRVVYTSSTGVYGHATGEWVTEETAPVPADPAAEAMLEGETIVKSAKGGVVLRLAGIYGPGRTRLVDSVRDGSARRTLEVEYTNRIHRDDCVGAIAHLLAHERPDDLYLGVDHEPAPKNDVLDFLAERLGVPAPPLEPRSPASYRAGRGHKRCDGTKLRASGYRFEFPTFREGYDALLREVQRGSLP